MLNVLFIGDVVGFSGLDFICKKLNELRDNYQADFIIVNGENICNGKGITENEANLLFEAGANVITTGNHIWDNWMSKPLLKSNNLVLRPFNYPPGNVGRGCAVLELPTFNVKIGVLQLQGRVFMSPIDCPFRGADFALKTILNDTKIIIVDFHAEATSEKMSLGYYLDGKVSAVIGTHTHVQTADAQILEKGTAYISDVGMTGAHDSVVGLRKDVSLNRHLYQVAHRYEPATEQNRASGAIIAINENNGKAVSIQNFVLPDFCRNR